MSDGPLPGGLVEHLRDAVALNRSRRDGYRQRGGARAGALSRALVGAERALLPVAAGLDRRAAPFVRAGVPVLVGALAPLTDAPAADRPVPLVGGPSGLLTPDLAGPLAATRRALGIPDLGGVVRELASALQRVQAAEAWSDDGPRQHLALTGHVLESALSVAGQGRTWAEESGGATLPLTCRVLWGHLVLLPAALRLDRAARPLHARGVGLFVNDLPPIPLPAAHG